MAFKKGQSGNPGGRPKAEHSLIELARAHTAEAIKTLVDIMRNSANDTARAGACEKLLDRGWGRPAQAMELTGKDGGPLEVRELPSDLDLAKQLCHVLSVSANRQETWH